MVKTALSASAIEDCLNMEQRWLALARSYEFAEKLSKFTETFRKGKRDACWNQLVKSVFGSGRPGTLCGPTHKVGAPFGDSRDGNCSAGRNRNSLI